LESWHIYLERSASRFAGLPEPFWQLGTDASLTDSLAQGFGVIAFVCRKDLWPFMRSAECAGFGGYRVQQRHELRALVAMSQRRASGSWHAHGLGETVEQIPLAFPPVGAAVTAALARRKRSHRRRGTASESARVLQQAREGRLVRSRGCH